MNDQQFNSEDHSLMASMFFQAIVSALEGSMKRKLTKQEVMEGLKAYYRQMCAESGKCCIKCPKRYDNLCPAAKVEICLN